MNMRTVWACVVICAVSSLLAGTASAQWSSPTSIGVVEGVPTPGIIPSVSTARCGNSVVV